MADDKTFTEQEVADMRDNLATDGGLAESVELTSRRMYAALDETAPESEAETPKPKTPEPKAETKAKAEPESQPDVEDGEQASESPASLKAPWDPQRQQRDQRFANLEKMVKTLTEQNAAMQEMIRTGSQSGDSIEAVQADIEALEKLDGLASDEELAAHQKALDRLTKRMAKLAKQPSRPKPKPEAKGEKGEKGGDETEAPADGASQDDIDELLTAADEKYGKELRGAAVREIAKVFKARGYSDANIPTKQAVEDIVYRVYADLRHAKDANAAKKAAERTKKQKEQPGTGTPASAAAATTVEQAAARIGRPASLVKNTVEWVARKAREKIAAGGTLPGGRG
jgi:hypothetical protein